MLFSKIDFVNCYNFEKVNMVAFWGVGMGRIVVQQLSLHLKMLCFLGGSDFWGIGIVDC